MKDEGPNPLSSFNIIITLTIHSVQTQIKMNRRRDSRPTSALSATRKRAIDAAKRRHSTCSSSSGSSRSLTSSHYLDEYTSSKSTVQNPPLEIETIQENSSLKQESVSTASTSMESRNDKEDTPSFRTSKETTCESTRADDMERDAASKSDASSSSTKIRYEHESRQDEKYLKYIEHGLVKDQFTAKVQRATSEKYVPCSVGRSDAFVQYRKEQDLKMKIKNMKTVTFTNMTIVNEDGLRKKKVQDNLSQIGTFGKPYEVEVKSAKKGFYRPDLAEPKESSLSESYDSSVDDQEEENDNFNFLSKAISEVTKVFFSVPK